MDINPKISSIIPYGFTYLPGSRESRVDEFYALVEDSNKLGIWYNAGIKWFIMTEMVERRKDE